MDNFNLDKEIIRRLKVDIAALEAAISQKDAKLLEMEKDHSGLLMAATLKFGTMVAPGTMEMTVPARSADMFTMTTTYHPENEEHVIRVRRDLKC